MVIHKVIHIIHRQTQYICVGKEATQDLGGHFPQK